uniref:Uncharacterized protein n=1 Tax=Klebsiella phage Phi_KR8 TaxID=3240397 RepID=A0AB39U1D2_9CAUD
MAIAVHVKFENSDTRLLCYDDNETLSSIKEDLEEELIGVNGPISDFSVASSYYSNDELESEVYDALRIITSKSWER